MNALQAFYLGKGGLYPYIALILFGFLPSEIWRWFSVLAARRLDEQSAVVVLSKTMASVLLVGVVARLVLEPAGELAATPLWVRVGAMVCAMIAFAAFKRSIFAAVLCGEIAIIVGAALFKAV